MKKMFVVVFILAAACVTNRQALNESRKNAVWIPMVKLGQTTAEVRTVMKKDPESQSTKVLQDGTTEESWNYLTDYGNDTNTTILFRAGRVVEISQTRWLGNGNFNGPRDSATPH